MFLLFLAANIERILINQFYFCTFVRVKIDFARVKLHLTATLTIFKHEDMGKDIDAEHLCDVIKNLRLFTNTNKEWKEKYGSLYKPGQKEKLLDVLNAQCKKEYDEDFDLYEFMEEYRVSCKNEFVDKHKRDVILTNNKYLLSLIRYKFMPEDTPIPDELTAWKDDLDGYLKCEPVLLLLWSIVDHERHIKALPFFDERSGNVDIQSYDFFIKELRKLLTKVFPAETIYGKDLPIIITEFKKINAKYNDKTIVRMDLVMLVYNVLSNVIINCNRDELYYAIKEIVSKNTLSLDICGDSVCWIKPDCVPLKQVYIFEKMGIYYSLCRYDLETYKYTNFSVNLYSRNGRSYASVLGPKTILNLVKSEPFSEDSFLISFINVKYDGDLPVEIEFEPVTGGIKELPRKLERTSIENLCEISHDLAVCNFDQFENAYPEYDYDSRNMERLISADYIFIEKDSEEMDNGSRNVTSWFRIPRYDNPAWNIDQIQVDDQIFHIHLFGEEYLFFDPLNLSLKVTTAEDLASQHIVVMSVPSFAPDVDTDGASS